MDGRKQPIRGLWQRNGNFIARIAIEDEAGVKSNRKKDGSLNARGARALAGKKPLIDSGFLRQQIVQNATPTALTVEATALYAAMHQFGGTTAANSMIPGKNIPARPYLPIYQDGTLYPQERDLILAEINGYLLEGLQ